MRPASSKARQNNLPLSVVQGELVDQIKKLTLLQGDRLEFKKQAEDTQAKNQQWIDKLRQQNRKLKEQRDDLICKRRSNTTGDSRISRATTIQIPELRNETYWRRQLDRQKFLTKTMKNNLVCLQDKLKDVDNNKVSYIEESPLMRNIRILENRLDKVMIKYNEANSMTETYEQIVKRLKQQRIGYDNQITAIERSLKGKESDFEQLLLLAHDASHARENAQAELKKFEHKRSAIKDLREQYMSEKKTTIEGSKLQVDTDQRSMMTASNIRPAKKDPEGQNQIDDLEEYEQAFKKLKDVTGVSDANEVIQKFKTQGMTSKSLEELRQRYKGMIENLRVQKQQIKERLNKTKYEGMSTGIDKKKADEYESMLDKVTSQAERSKAKCQKTNKALVNVRVAVEHLATYLDFMKKEDNTQSSQINAEDLLLQIMSQMKQCYSRVKNDPRYNSQKFKQSTAGLERYIKKGGDGDGPVNTKVDRLFKREGEDSGNQYDEQIDEATNDRIKQRNQPAVIKPVISRNFRKFKA